MACMSLKNKIDGKAYANWKVA